MKGELVSIVGAQAFAKRDRELGRHHQSPKLALEPEALRDLLDSLRYFFGKNLGAIREPRFRESVIELENYLRDNTQDKSSQIKMTHLLELHLLNSSLSRWRKYPNFDKIIADYKADYLHATCLTATASVLVDRGNDLEITLEKRGQRTPDLTIAPTWDTRVATEIKTPMALRHGKTITEQEARDIIDKAFKSAGTQEGGQLSPDNQGILIIGSFYLENASLENLAKAAENNFNRVKGKRTHILALIFTNISFAESRNPDDTLRGIRSSLVVKRVLNPEYGQHEIVMLDD